MQAQVGQCITDRCDGSGDCAGGVAAGAAADAAAASREGEAGEDVCVAAAAGPDADAFHIYHDTSRKAEQAAGAGRDKLTVCYVLVCVSACVCVCFRVCVCLCVGSCSSLRAEAAAACSKAPRSGNVPEQPQCRRCA